MSVRRQTKQDKEKRQRMFVSHIIPLNCGRLARLALGQSWAKHQKTREGINLLINYDTQRYIGRLFSSLEVVGGKKGRSRTNRLRTRHEETLIGQATLTGQAQGLARIALSIRLRVFQTAMENAVSCAHCSLRDSSNLALISDDFSVSGQFSATLR